MGKQTELIVTIKNEELTNWLGDPLTISTLQPDGSVISAHANVAEVVKNLLRSRDPQNGQSLVVKNLEDAERVRVLGMALREATDGVLRIPFGEHKWLVEKAKEVGFRYLPNDITIFIEALESGQKANILVGEVAKE